MRFVITNGEEYWNNQDGWVELFSATSFSENEAEQLNLPIGGKWQSMAEANSKVFANFICVCLKGGLLDEIKLKQLADVSDQSYGDFNEILKRAQAV